MCRYRIAFRLNTCKPEDKLKRVISVVEDVADIAPFQATLLICNFFSPEHNLGRLLAILLRHGLDDGVLQDLKPTGGRA